jgi:hypothetical protein
MSGRERTVDTQHQPAYSGKHFMKSRVPKEVRQWASRNGKKGGHTITKRKGPAKTLALQSPQKATGLKFLPLADPKSA